MFALNLAVALGLTKIRTTGAQSQPEMSRKSDIFRLARIFLIAQSAASPQSVRAFFPEC
jgi:hypothetical protein